MWALQNFNFANVEWGKEFSKDNEFLLVTSHINNF